MSNAANAAAETRMRRRTAVNLRGLLLREPLEAGYCPFHRAEKQASTQGDGGVEDAVASHVDDGDGLRGRPGSPLDQHRATAWRQTPDTHAGRVQSLGDEWEAVGGRGRLWGAS